MNAHLIHKYVINLVNSKINSYEKTGQIVDVDYKK